MFYQQLCANAPPRVNGCCYKPSTSKGKVNGIMFSFIFTMYDVNRLLSTIKELAPAIAVEPLEVHVLHC